MEGLGAVTTDSTSVKQTEKSTTPAVILTVVSAVCAILLTQAAISAEENPAIFWSGVSAVLCASLSIVLAGSIVAVRRSSRSGLRLRRVAAWTLGLFATTLVGIVVGGQGADSWCTNEGFRLSPGFGQSLSMSAWPPGVRCTLTYDGERSEVYWPVNW